jgi:N-acyl-D-amino-acid deacylase
MSSVTAFRANYHKKVAINTAYLAPNGTLRLEVAGWRDVPLTGDLMERYKRLLRESIEQGAVGFTTGSAYYPGPWTSTDELVEICTLLKELDRVYMTEPRRANPSAPSAEAGCPRRWRSRGELGSSCTSPTTEPTRTPPGSHAGHGRHRHRQGAGRGRDTGHLPLRHRQLGADQLPAQRGPRGRSAGDPSALEGPHLAGAHRRVRHGRSEGHASAGRGGGVVHPKTPQLEGISLSQIARERGLSLGEALCDVLYENDLALGYCLAPPMSYGLWHRVSKDSMDLIAREDFMVCSDITPAGTMPHPRSYGAFPRFMGRLRREFPTVSVEGMVHRMTDRPARRFGIAQRGRIQKGYYADITLFDAERVVDTATFDDPRQHPVGIPYVWSMARWRWITTAAPARSPDRRCRREHRRCWARDSGLACRSPDAAATTRLRRRAERTAGRPAVKRAAGRSSRRQGRSSYSNLYLRVTPTIWRCSSASSGRGRLNRSRWG